MTVPEYLCFVCYHHPSVHGLTGRTLDPCLCCSSPAAVGAARAHLILTAAELSGATTQPRTKD